MVPLMRCVFTLICAGAINGVARAKTIKGTDKRDILAGGAPNDVIYAYNGPDQAFGSRGDDKLYGGRGNDYLSGDEGNDVVFGSEGNDIIHEYEVFGNDQLHGGDGSDIIYHVQASAQMWGDQGQDILIGSKGRDVLKGGAGFDVLLPSRGDDKIYPGLGGVQAVSGQFDNYLSHYNILQSAPTSFNNYIDPSQGADLIVLRMVGSREKPVRDLIKLTPAQLEADALNARVKVVKNFNINQDKLYIPGGIKSEFGTTGEFLTYTVAGKAYKCAQFVSRNATKILETATIFA